MHAHTSLSSILLFPRFGYAVELTGDQKTLSSEMLQLLGWQIAWAWCPGIGVQSYARPLSSLQDAVNISGESQIPCSSRPCLRLPADPARCPQAIKRSKSQAKQESRKGLGGPESLPGACQALAETLYDSSSNRISKSHLTISEARRTSSSCEAFLNKSSYPIMCNLRRTCE